MTLRPAAAALIPFALAAAPAQAQGGRDDQGPQRLVDKAASVVIEMKRDPHVARLLGRAAGVFVVPEYGRAAFLIGGRGGAGVVLARGPRGWTTPAFYDFGGLSVGLQAGGAGGAIAYILMDDKAVRTFVGHDKLALNANAGLSVVTYSKGDQADVDRGDVVLWTDVRGAYAGLNVEAGEVHRDARRTRQYYGRETPTGAILNGQAVAPGAHGLQAALAR